MLHTWDNVVDEELKLLSLKPRNLMKMSSFSINLLMKKFHSSKKDIKKEPPKQELPRKKGEY